MLTRYEKLLRRLRQSPKLWETDTVKIDRVLARVKARVLSLRVPVQTESAYARVMWM